MKQITILVDSHVHIYSCYSVKRFFDFAIKNFIIESKKLNSKKFVGVLFLTETKNDNYFRKLRENQFDNELDNVNLKLIKSEENNSLVYRYNDDTYLIIISGKQIITSEKLEVLALGTTKDLDYGESLRKSVEKINSVGALPVIPWGVAKWIGKRERIIKNFLETNIELKYFLGDNSGRPVFWSTPKLFKIARAKGVMTLRGSDPLPLSSQEEKVGRFGFYFNANLDLNCPAKDVNGYLLNSDSAPNDFGKLEVPLNFLKNQFSMQFRKLF